MRDMLQVLGGRVGGGMLLTMDEHQPDLACFSMAVSVFPRWSWWDPGEQGGMRVCGGGAGACRLQ